MFDEKKWNKYLYQKSLKEENVETIEEFKEPAIYEARIILNVTGDRNITDILNDVRAIEGITVVDTEETKQFLGRKKSVIKMKYLVVNKLPQEYKEFLRKALPHVHGVTAARIVFARPVGG